MSVFRVWVGAVLVAEKKTREQAEKRAASERKKKTGMVMITTHDQYALENEALRLLDVDIALGYHKPEGRGE